MNHSRLVEKAKLFATYAHFDQFRKYYDEVPYIVHPERVAHRVAEFTNDENVVAAAWLHDTVEDCNVTFAMLEWDFGFAVANLVEELTNTSKRFSHLNRAERKEIDRNHIGKASKDAQLIKAIDRIDNLKDIVLGPAGFKMVYAKETLLLLEVLTKAPEILRDELRCLANSF